MRLTLATAIALALVTAAPQAPAQTAAAQAQGVTTQLPRGVTPTHYAVEITPHAKDMNFDGKVAITVDVAQPTNTITLQALRLKIAKASLVPAKGKAMSAKVSVDEANQTASFAFDKTLAPGNYTLNIEYSGVINTQANGLFALDYSTKEGSKRALYTQFENSDARAFIPSWDEPNFKATFDLTAIVPEADLVVGNMPIASSSNVGNGLKKVVFQRSPKMSTYLLFFAAGDFERATKMSGKTEIGVVTQKGMVDQAKYALDGSAEIVKRYNDYFGVDYPLPKLDNVAAPGQSQFFSAMENWGGIFTFEYSLLVNPQVSTDNDKRRIFSTAAHEIAHQWFGNLVTMQWWDDLWLNEGFASWMESRATREMHPEWNTTFDAVGAREGAMGRDSLSTTHPVVQHIETVEQASQAFDAITYSKGEAVITMLEAFKGENEWRDGVRRYMKKHAYGNTASADLWAAMDADGSNPITAIAQDFTTQPGVPTITVANAKCDAGKTTVDLIQGEYSRDMPDKKALTWRVPVMAQVPGNAVARTTVTDGKGSITVEGCGPVVVNAGQTGYFRTMYAPAQFAVVNKSFKSIKPVDQFGILADAWAFGVNGKQPVSDYLDLAMSIDNTADPTIQSQVIGVLASLDNYFTGDKAAQAKYRAFAIKRIKPAYDKLGFEDRAGDSDAVKGLRRTVVGALAGLEDKDIIAEARARYAAQDSKPLTPALRRTVYGIVAYNADAATWDKMHAMAKAETNPLVKSQLYGMLSGVKEEALAKKALALALTDEPGATLSAGMIRGVAGEHPDMTFDWAVQNREAVTKLVDTTSAPRYFPGIGSGSSKPEMVAKIRDFASKYIAEGSRKDAENAVTSIETRIKARQRMRPQIDSWLSKQK